MKSMPIDLRSTGRDRVTRSRRPADLSEGLEKKELLTGASVACGGSYVYIVPASTGPNTTVVSYQLHNGSTMLDVNLNGANHYYNPAQVTSVYYMGQSATGAQNFQDGTHSNVYALGGSGSNVFVGGSGSDSFIGGSGSNTFYGGTGFTSMQGGTGTDAYYENALGTGIIQEEGGSDTIYPPAGLSANYAVRIG